MSDKKQNNFFGGKGYYIALILCAAAIGISGLVYYRNSKEDITLQAPGEEDQSVLSTQEQDLPVVATKPGSSDTPTTEATENTRPQPRKVLQTQFPVEGQTVAVYAMDSLSYNPTTRDWRVHNGIDIAADPGTQVYAAADGTVYTTYQDETMGTTVVIRHEGGYTTKYASLSEDLAVSAGDEVVMGQTIGTVGVTAMLENAIGEHVHFSVTCNDEPMDPEAFFALE